MKTTTNYGFKQPEGTDIVNIDDISDNFGSVDTEIKKANDKVVAHEGKGGSVHADVTTTTSGFMSAVDKVKLNGVATNANNYSHPTGDGNLHVPATGTSNNGKVLKVGSTAGSLAWGTLTSTDVGALATSHEGQGGTVHADVTTTVSGFMSAADKTKLNGIATGANKVESSTTNGNIKVNGTETNVYTHPTGTNPHGATKADIGLSNVTNDSQVKRSEMGVANGVSTLDANGVNKQPPISHASTGTSYGVADTSNYGHVKVGNGIAASSGTISVDVGDGVVLSGNSPNQKLVADVGTGLTLEGTSPNRKIALANSGVTAGTYEKVTVDAKGRVTSGGDLTASDIPNIPWSKITSGKPTTLEGYGITDGQQYALTQNNGVSKLQPDNFTDFNDIIDTGFYVLSNSSSGILNSPILIPSGQLIVTKRSADNTSIGQIFIVANSGDMYIRHSNAGTWSYWKKVLTDKDNVQQFALTNPNGSLKLATDDFDTMIETGIYKIHAGTKPANSPDFAPGDLYGHMIVTNDGVRTQTLTMSMYTQVYVFSRVYSGNPAKWSAWAQLSKAEKGAWTPEVTINGSVSGITYSGRSGWYVRSGDMVTVGCFLALTSRGTNAGEVKITGLPFTPDGDSYGILQSYGMGIATPTTGMARNGAKEIQIFVGFNTTGGWGKLQNTHLSNTTGIGLTITYRV